MHTFLFVLGREQKLQRFSFKRQGSAQGRIGTVQNHLFDLLQRNRRLAGQMLCQLEAMWHQLIVIDDFADQTHLVGFIGTDQIPCHAQVHGAKLANCTG